MLKSNTSFLLIDVRTPSEYNKGHIIDAINIPLDQLDYNINGISNYKYRPVVVYCKGGKRSAIAAEMLINNGFTNVYNLSGGYDVYNRKTKINGIYTKK